MKAGYPGKTSHKIAFARRMGEGGTKWRVRFSADRYRWDEKTNGLASMQTILENLVFHSLVAVRMSELAIFFVSFASYSFFCDVVV